MKKYEFLEIVFSFFKILTKIQVAEDITKNLIGIKTILYGTSDQEPQTEQIAQLAQEIYAAQLIKIMIDNLQRVDFEGKKDIASIFNNLLRRQIGNYK